MYRITIKTLYNTIVLEREETNTPELQEIYDQPYIVQVEIEHLEKAKTKVLQKGNNMLYLNCV